MSWDLEDIHLGNYSEIGEALRGMQDDAYNVGAASPRAMQQLRGALGQIASNRFGHHAPMQRTMRSPYKDSTQIGIQCTGTFTPSVWTGGTLPQISGLTRVYKSFKPTKAILTEILTFTFVNSTLGTTTVAAFVQQAADLVLVSAFAGADNCFPNAPTQGSGIAGPTFAANSLGNGISWPTINGGIDMTVAFAIEATAQFQVTPPAGYTQAQLTQIGVNVRFNLLGPSLR